MGNIHNNSKLSHKHTVHYRILSLDLYLLERWIDIDAFWLTGATLLFGSVVLISTQEFLRLEFHSVYHFAEITWICSRVLLFIFFERTGPKAYLKNIQTWLEEWLDSGSVKQNAIRDKRDMKSRCFCCGNDFKNVAVQKRLPFAH